MSHLRKFLNLDDTTAQRYLMYIQEAINDRTRMGQSELSGVCLNRSNLATPEALDAALKSMDVRLDAREVQLAKNSVTILSQEEMSALNKYIRGTVLATMTVSRIDTRKFVETTGETVEVILDRLCSRLKP